MDWEYHPLLCAIAPAQSEFNEDARFIAKMNGHLKTLENSITKWQRDSEKTYANLSK